jgi:hypothetical protein
LLPLSPTPKRIPSSPRRHPGVGPRILQTQTWEKLRQGTGRQSDLDPRVGATGTIYWRRGTLKSRRWDYLLATRDS